MFVDLVVVDVMPRSSGRLPVYPAKLLEDETCPPLSVLVEYEHSENGRKRKKKRWVTYGHSDMLLSPPCGKVCIVGSFSKHSSGSGGNPSGQCKNKVFVNAMSSTRKLSSAPSGELKILKYCHPTMSPEEVKKLLEEQPMLSNCDGEEEEYPGYSELIRETKEEDEDEDSDWTNLGTAMQGLSKESKNLIRVEFGKLLMNRTQSGLEAAMDGLDKVKDFRRHKTAGKDVRDLFNFQIRRSSSSQDVDDSESGGDSSASSDSDDSSSDVDGEEEDGDSSSSSDSEDSNGDGDGKDEELGTVYTVDGSSDSSKDCHGDEAVLDDVSDDSTSVKERVEKDDKKKKKKTKQVCFKDNGDVGRDKSEARVEHESHKRNERGKSQEKPGKNGGVRRDDDKKARRKREGEVVEKPQANVGVEKNKKNGGRKSNEKSRNEENSSKRPKRKNKSSCNESNKKLRDKDDDGGDGSGGGSWKKSRTDREPSGDRNYKLKADKKTENRKRSSSANESSRKKDKGNGGAEDRSDKSSKLKADKGIENTNKGNGGGEGDYVNVLDVCKYYRLKQSEKLDESDRLWLERHDAYLKMFSECEKKHANKCGHKVKQLKTDNFACCRRHEKPP